MGQIPPPIMPFCGCHALGDIEYIAALVNKYGRKVVTRGGRMGIMVEAYLSSDTRECIPKIFRELSAEEQAYIELDAAYPGAGKDI